MGPGEEDSKLLPELCRTQGPPRSLKHMQRIHMWSRAFAAAHLAHLQGMRVGQVPELVPEAETGKGDRWKYSAGNHLVP